MLLIPGRGFGTYLDHMFKPLSSVQNQGGLLTIEH